MKSVFLFMKLMIYSATNTLDTECNPLLEKCFDTKHHGSPTDEDVEVAGEIILQREVRVEPGDDADALAARVLKTEHIILAEGVQKVIDEIEGGK